MLTYESWLPSGAVQAHIPTRAAQATRNCVQVPQHWDQQIAQATVPHPGTWTQPWEQADAQEKGHQPEFTHTECREMRGRQSLRGGKRRLTGCPVQFSSLSNSENSRPRKNAGGLEAIEQEEVRVPWSVPWEINFM